MRNARTVGWDSSSGEFQFVADDPGPALLVTPDLLDEAIHQRDGSYVLTAYTSPDHSTSEQFTVQPPVLQLARSMLPANARAATAQQAAVEAVERPLAFSPQAPRPPLPASASPHPVSFLTPRFEPVGEKQEVVPMNWDAQPPPAPELITNITTSQAGSVGSEDRWIVRYVMTDTGNVGEPNREMMVTADSDASALRALHTELHRDGGEVTYRVLAVVPASQAEVAA